MCMNTSVGSPATCSTALLALQHALTASAGRSFATVTRAVSSLILMCAAHGTPTCVGSFVDDTWTLNYCLILDMVQGLSVGP